MAGIAQIAFQIKRNRLNPKEIAILLRLMWILVFLSHATAIATSLEKLAKAIKVQVSIVFSEVPPCDSGEKRASAVGAFAWSKEEDRNAKHPHYFNG